MTIVEAVNGDLQLWLLGNGILDWLYHYQEPVIQTMLVLVKLQTLLFAERKATGDQQPSIWQWRILTYPNSNPGAGFGTCGKSSHSRSNGFQTT